MNKKELKALWDKLCTQRKEVFAKIDAAKDEAELDTINLELRKLDSKITQAKADYESAPDDDEPAARSEPTPPSPVNPLASFRATEPATVAEESEDVYATMEYRKAFRDYVTRGIAIPEKFPSPALRANTTTTTADVSAVIPSTILNEVIRKLESYGQIYQRIRKLNIQGGVSVPILSIVPTATWIDEDSISERQKVTANTKVSFMYYGLECRVSMSLLAATVTLAGFESLVQQLVTEGIVKAIDTAVIKGTGEGQPLGITKDTRVPTKNIVTLTAAEFTSWEAWKKKVFAKLGIKYKAGAELITASGTYEGYIDGMVDKNGQPIGRTNYGIADGPTGRFAGKPVLEVEDDIIANYDDAAVGDVVAILANLTNYAWNSNLQMTMYRYFDHEKNEWVDKAILIADGKLLDPNGVIIIKKGAAE